MDRASSPTTPSLETVRRIAESVIIAVISSAGLYLVGSVYVDAYYGRLAIEATSLDLPPPYVALQSVHALWGLFDYPFTLLLITLLYRVVAAPSRRSGQWLGRLRERFPRLVPVLANLIVVAPLLVRAAASLREQELPHRSALTEISSLLGYVGLLLLAYSGVRKTCHAEARSISARGKRGCREPRSFAALRMTPFPHGAV
ncbi:MAG: hypothetical protein IT338_05895, partial [Thermomicrobiales bacterium]|nr:hypothetical protein [Thermomicrobiales bacterium]